LSLLPLLVLVLLLLLSLLVLLLLLIHGMGTRRYVLSVDDDNEFRSRCE
jgi:hypothetical protein